MGAGIAAAARSAALRDHADRPKVAWRNAAVHSANRMFGRH
jgi:hypothetical protein